MKSLIVIAVLMLVFSPAVLAAPAGNADDGKELFAKKCAICHGKDASGNGPAAKAFNPPIPSLASKEVQALSDADIQKVITEGKGKMKPVKDLTKGDLANLIAFIRSLAKK
ncbi:MAG: cytochrome c [Candidatus Acidiferrales bacterium]